MMNLEGSKTLENLKAAFAGESQARNKYTYYASQAKKDGYEQIAEIFTETANNEKEHAKLWFKYINGGAVPKTIDNLKDAAAVQKFFLEEIQLGEELLAQGDYEKGVDHLTNAIAASAAAASVPADSSTTSVPDAPDQASDR